MSDRVYTAIFYIALIMGSSWVTVSVGEALTREALTKLALMPSADPRPSRVDTFLAAQDRATPPQNTKEPLVPTASSLPVGALAKAMDEAEQSGVPAAAQTPEASDAAKPRVAGWSRRLPTHASSADETTGHIIMRTLRADM
ncbi:MAG: hypothetical protein JSR99_03190 [Proteobacteria bacterium]|nr:hypothetical protein [Pseudomonadota bacterium]